jgi:two-component system alkaline phosphatase synthesis response regulator PhoP
MNRNKEPKKFAVIADDDKDTLRNLVGTLELEGFDVALALDNSHAVKLVKKHKPKLIISEAAKENYDGINLLGNLRKDISNWPDTRFIILTSNTTETLEINAFDLGVDDFLLKPIRPNAFRKRIHKYSRDAFQLDKAPVDVITLRDLKLDPFHKRVLKAGKDKPEKIQSKTFDILYFLARNHDQVFSREKILQMIWGDQIDVTPRSIDVHVLKIRTVLGEGYVKTIKGVGYKFLSK